jgi:type IV secretion system protein VirB8
VSGAIKLASETWQARPLDDKEKAGHLKTATTRAEDMMRASAEYRSSGKACFIAGAIALVAAAAALALNAWTWTPSEPFVIAQRPDGTLEPMMRATKAAAAWGDDIAKAHLRKYLDVCEQYHPDTVPLNRKRCALLLNPQQQDEYAKWFGSRNPASPQREYGKTGNYSVADNVTYSKRGKEGLTQAWDIRFIRVEWKNNQHFCRPWLVGLTFQFRPELEMSEEDRAWNLGGMQILDRSSQPDPSVTHNGKCF